MVAIAGVLAAGADDADARLKNQTLPSRISLVADEVQVTVVRKRFHQRQAGVRSSSL
jgi:hypothetical protein